MLLIICAVEAKLTCSRYWEINYIDVYDAPVSTSSSSSTQLTSSSTSSTFPVISTGIYANQSSTGSMSTLASLSTSGSANIPTSLTVPVSTTAGASTPASASMTGAPTSTPTASLTRDPAAIGDFVLLGCFGSNSSFVTFSSAGTDNAMTPEVCVGLCSARKYAGVFDE